MKRFSAVAGLLALLAGVPLTLLALSGPPHWPSFAGISLSDNYLDPQLVLRSLAFVIWIFWVLTATLAMLRVAAVLAGASHVPGASSLLSISAGVAPKSLRRLVDVAIGGMFVAASLTAVRGSTAPRASVRVVAEVDQSHAMNHAYEVKRHTYRVQPGDSLWRIAEKHLGSGFRWREVYDLNRGHRFADGQKLSNPRLIRPGWTLSLPESNEQKHAVREVVDLPRRPVVHAPDRPAPHAVQGPQATETPERVGRSPGPVVHLPSGLALAGTFVAGLLSAELMSRLRRRRARALDTSTVPLEDEPELVRYMRHVGPPGMRLEAAVVAVSDAWRSAKLSEPRFLFVNEGTRKVTLYLRDEGGAMPPRSGGRLSPAVEFKRGSPFVIAEVRGPFTPLSAGPTRRTEAPSFIALGAAREGVVHVSLDALRVLSLTGSHSARLARDMILALAATTAPDDLRILMLGRSHELDSLKVLPHVDATRAEVLGEAVQDLQAEYLRRARLFSEEDVEDLNEHDQRHSDDRLPRFIVVAVRPPTQLQGVLEALGREGERFGGSLIAVDWSPPAADIAAVVDERSVQLTSRLPIPAQLNSLTLDEASARDALEIVRSAWPESDEHEEIDTQQQPEAASNLRAEGTSDRPHSVEGKSRAAPLRELLPSASISPADDEEAPLVRCLGPYVVERGTRLIHKGWRSKAKEMLAYLVVHPEGASKDRLIDMLWPELGPDATEREFKRSTAMIRSQVRRNDESRKYVVKVGESFGLESGAWASDAWEFTTLLERSREAPADEEQELLVSALGLYRGDFCSDCYYSWAEPIREKYRRMFLRASARLAELLAATEDLEAALSILERAIEVDQLNEELCRRAMGVEAALGRVDEAKTRFRKLEAVLAAEIGADPSSASLELIREIELMSLRKPADYLEIVRRLESEEVAVASGNMP